jgi:hypothetical protein
MDKEILENNVLIAEFMGAEKIQYPAPIYGIYKFPVSPDKKHTKMDAIYFEYHTSWDWLMPVCVKWDDLHTLKNFQTHNYFRLCGLLDRALTYYIITPVYNQLVENIKIYNRYKRLYSEKCAQNNHTPKSQNTEQINLLSNDMGTTVLEWHDVAKELNKQEKNKS